MSKIKNTVLLGAVVLFALIGCDDTQSNSTANYAGNGLSASKCETLEQSVTINGIVYSLSRDKSSYTVTFAWKTTGDVIIESHINDIPVTEIKYSFSLSNITSITVPDTISALPELFASGCRNLTKVTLPDSITSIGGGAFDGCTSLASFTIPPKVTAIPSLVFNRCHSLTEITIPSGVKSTGALNFTFCSNLRSITLSYGIETIGDWLCMETPLTSVVIPSSVTSIGACAFLNCRTLKTIIVQAATPPALNALAFQAIASDAVFMVPAASLDAYKAAPVWKGKNLAAYTPAATVTVNGIVYSLNATANGYIATNASAAPEDATIESSIDGLPVSINPYLFISNNTITSLTIKHGITQIPYGMCLQATKLTKVALPDSITVIEYLAFQSCVALKSINIPSGVTSIADRTFKNCTALEEISIPSNVTSIGKYAFQNCSSIEEISIPSNVTSIDMYAFPQCSALKKINFSEGLKTIGSMAFAYDNALTEIVLPASVTSIDYLAFADCTALKTVTVKAATPPTLGNGTFARIASDAVFYVPAASLEVYKTASRWSTLNLAAIQ
jgi:hypothetical protein